MLHKTAVEYGIALPEGLDTDKPKEELAREEEEATAEENSLEP